MGQKIQNREVAVQLSGVKKQYRLGQIGGGTLQRDIQSWWAKRRGKEDPNTKIGQEERLVGETFMALNGIDLTIYKGEAVGIIGGNGAGKSTMLKLLSRVTAPSEGTIDIYGRIASMLEVGTGFNGEMTGRENVYMNGAILGMTKAEIDKKMEDIIDFSEVREFIDTPVKRYSSGMYVKLAFSVAAHLDSEIMIMDEVLAVGDMAFQKKCLTKMRDAAKKEGRTVLYVSHNMNTIRQLCDRCIVLDKGKVVYEGDVETAIRIYMGSDAGELRRKYYLEEVKRPSAFHGSQFKVKEFEFLNKEEATFFSNEKICFRIKWTAIKDIRKLRMRFSIHDADEARIIGTTQSEIFADVIKNEEGESTLELDISNLASGKYFFEIDVYAQNEFGAYCSYDHPTEKVYFRVERGSSTEDITWNKQYFGNIVLNRMKKIDAAN